MVSQKADPTKNLPIPGPGRPKLTEDLKRAMREGRSKFHQVLRYYYDNFCYKQIAELDNEGVLVGDHALAVSMLKYAYEGHTKSQTLVCEKLQGKTINIDEEPGRPTEGGNVFALVQLIQKYKDIPTEKLVEEYDKLQEQKRLKSDN